ncbi:putative mediator of RNA polymerase II transcription subunit 26 [Anastrepha ludens]|uniref:putative mediator of RNA polymerase II transcription subunit 26 n=1 Tax=Anastrepha ludens TaxID=28586 RepID=UPI0023B10829|nr:putative mediator of RNA polymerase II transcription subunit 26 [Anastrepha ludens]
MRPPAMQTTALQQNNEVHINTQRQRQLQQQQLQPTQHHQLPLQLRPPQYQQQQQQQQLQLQLQLQQQPQTTSLTLLNHSSYDTAATTASQQARKYRFEQHDFTVDKPLNFVATTTAAATTDEVTIAAPKLNERRTSAAYPATVRLPVDDKTRQKQFVQQQHFHHQQQPQRTSLDCMQLLDLSTSPPHEPIYPLQGSISTYLPQRPLVDVPPPYRRASAASVAPVQTHRASYASQYSRSSSSEDGSIGGSNAVHFPKTYSRACSAFDDAAEHFIINFPAADSPLHNQNDCVINLPLSETEPLLTNIEATVSDKQRSIRLPKSSASLIFTKKDLLAQRTASIAPYHTANTNNNCATQQHQQQQSEQEKRNQPKQQQQQQQQQLHQSLSLRSANEFATRKPVKHLPASYQQQQPHPQQQQQQRRSLQLNYNNNLVTTSTCCSANNNYCRTTTGRSASGSDASSVGGSTGAGLHKHHHASGGQNLKAATPAATTTANVIPQQHQHKSQQQLQSGQNNTNTAAATRKQHAYSWYAPVYSALEEELEQDSRDSSPIHNLANTKKQHLNHYQHHRPTHNSSTAVDNETVALLETRNQVNIQAQLHAQANSNAHPGKDIIVGGGGGVGGGTVRAQQKHSGQAARRANGQAPSTLPLANAHNALLQSEMAASESGGGGVGLSSNTEHTSAPVNGYETEGGLVNSLSGTLPPRRRIENFLKSLVGRKSSSSARNSGNSGNGGNAEVVASVTMTSRIDNVVSQQPMPASPEITITGTPSEQNLVLLRDTSLRSGQYKQPLAATQEQRKSECGSDKLTANGAIQGSTSSLNVVQQKLWNMMRREGSAASLYNEKSHSIVQYRGLRKCETVLALTRQTNSLCSPVFGGSAAAHVGASGKHGGGGSGVARHNSCSAGGGAGGGSSSGMRRTHTTGSGIFSASGVEQIRPLNRLRNSITSVNAPATCSRCSSLLSLAASGSRYSLNVTSNGGGGLFVQAPTVQMPTSASQHQLQALAAHLDCKPPPHSSQQHQQQRERKISNVSSSQLNNNCNVLVSNRNADPNAAEQIASGGGNSSGNCSRKSSAGAPSTHSASSITPPSNMTTATLTSSITSPHGSTPTTPTATAIATTASVVAPEALVVTPTANVPHLQTAMSSYESTSNSNTSGILVDLPSSPTSATSSASTPCTSASCSSANTPAPTYAVPTISQTYPFTITSLLAMSKTAMARDGGRYSGSGEQDDDNAMTISMPSACKGTTRTDMSVMDGRDFVSYVATPAPVATQPTKHFEPFTCKLCLVDVEAKEEATTLQQCGCEFCTEVSKITSFAKNMFTLFQ